MDTSKIKLIAFDLDGTITQHKTPPTPENKETLVRLSKKYKLLMVGAGQVRRIFDQLEKFPIDIIGNYGLQEGIYDHEKNDIVIIRDEKIDCDRENIDEKITFLRNKYGFTEFAGDNTEFHPSGCITFPILGTKARQEDKLAFDPDRVKRRKIYADVCDTFADYSVFVGGSSSFDMAPKPYNKYYALDRYCEKSGLGHDEVVFVGDDYGLGGNDESVYLSDFNFIKVDDYREFANILSIL
ncbi:MAG: HAD-IIB family hydrolase [Clostridia bacterium]|nr:HAD-IIB family hydrolase [Clostridia bacterium]MBQ9749620.1 HAD-IIB family hydrolase [Clostridia bacterium]